MSTQETVTVEREEDLLDEAVLDIETAEFDQNFSEIDSSWRNLGPLEYLNEKNTFSEAYGIVGMLGYPTATFATWFAYNGGEEVSIPALALSGWMFGWVGAMMGAERVGDRINNLETNFDEKFEGEYREVDDFETVYRLLENSDKVNYSDTTGLPGSDIDPSPEIAKRDYRDLREVLEAEKDEWEKMLESEVENVLTEEERELIRSYSPEDDETDLVDIEDLQELQQLHRERLQNYREEISDREINQYVRVKPVEEEKYEGTAYQLEVYQGDDLKLQVEGLTRQDIENWGSKLNFLDSV